MNIPLYSPEEQNVVGTNKLGASFVDMMSAFGQPFPDTEPVYNRPITPRENLKRLLNGKNPYWLPFAEFGGFSTEDVQCFFPRQIPDNHVCHLCVDGGDTACQYPSLILNSSWFDLEWEFVPVTGGATVHPGNPKIIDMSEWEKTVKLPDLDAVNWKEMGSMNQEYLNTDKFNMLNILNGPWERLMSLMDVENAAIALIDESQEEGLHRFFDAYCDFLDAYIGRVTENCRIDGVLMHDDWGHQNGPFFSHQTAENMLFPYLKRIVESCHKRGLFYEQHSCGRNETFIDLYVKAGVNLYCPQDINDFDDLLERAKGSQLMIGIPFPDLPMDADPGMIKEEAVKWFEHYKDYRFVSSSFLAHPVLSAEIYELSRKEYAGKLVD